LGCQIAFSKRKRTNDEELKSIGEVQTRRRLRKGRRTGAFLEQGQTLTKEMVEKEKGGGEAVGEKVWPLLLAKAHKDYLCEAENRV